MSEKRIETNHVKRVKAKAGTSYKFTSPARRNVPDRLDLYPIPPIHQDIVGRYVVFTECKDFNKVPNAGQKREIARLVKLGFKVEICDFL